jgi:hypothetical protein
VQAPLAREVQVKEKQKVRAQRQVVQVGKVG